MTDVYAFFVYTFVWLLVLLYYVLNKRYKFIHLIMHLLTTSLVLSYTAITSGFYDGFVLVSEELHNLLVVIYAWITIPAMELLYLKLLPENNKVQYLIYTPIVVVVSMAIDFLIMDMGIIVSNGWSIVVDGVIAHTLGLYLILIVYKSVGNGIRDVYDNGE